MKTFALALLMTAVPTGRTVDRWFCVVWVDAPEGEECKAVVVVRKGRAKVASPVTCAPLPAPLGSDG